MDRIGDYVLLRELGRGVHGRVFLARAPARLGLDVEQVAVKVLAVPGSDTGFGAVAEELTAYADVGSERLLELYEVAMEGDTVYYAMRHEPHGSLAAPVREASRRQRLAAVGEAARAAHELHEAGIVHRAIKPGNVFLGHAVRCSPSRPSPTCCPARQPSPVSGPAGTPGPRVRRPAPHAGWRGGSGQ